MDAGKTPAASSATVPPPSPPLAVVVLHLLQRGGLPEPLPDAPLPRERAVRGPDRGARRAAPPGLPPRRLRLVGAGRPPGLAPAHHAGHAVRRDALQAVAVGPGRVVAPGPGDRPGPGVRRPRDGPGGRQRRGGLRGGGGAAIIGWCRVRAVAGQPVVPPPHGPSAASQNSTSLPSASPLDQLPRHMPCFLSKHIDSRPRFCPPPPDRMATTAA